MKNTLVSPLILIIGVAIALAIFASGHDASATDPPPTTGACYTGPTLCYDGYTKYECEQLYANNQAEDYPYWVPDACLDEAVYVHEITVINQCTAARLDETKQQCLAELEQSLSDPLLLQQHCQPGEILQMVYPQKILMATFYEAEALCSAHCGAILRCVLPGTPPLPTPGPTP